MGAVIKGGVGLALAVGLLTVVFALTGLHQNPLVSGLVGIAVAIALNVGAVFWVLRQTAAENGYGKQLLNGALVGIVGGASVFVVSWVLLTVVFPDYLPEAIEANIGFLEQAGLPEDALAKNIEKLESTTVAGQSFTGTIGTFFTSLVVGAIVAIFQRKR